MANINAPMYGNNRVYPSCVGGRDCCRMPMKTKRAVRQAEMREEMELAHLEAVEYPDELEDDPDWDGKLSIWDLPDDAVRVKYIPAPRDDFGW